MICSRPVLTSHMGHVEVNAGCNSLMYFARLFYRVFVFLPDWLFGLITNKIFYSLLHEVMCDAG